MSTSNEEVKIIREIKQKVGNTMRLDQIPTLRCIHRHTISEHPNCFLEGKIKWPNDKTFEKYTEVPWFFWEGHRIGYLDIEVDNLNANLGTMLTWALKQKEGNVVYDYVTKDELFNSKIRDKRIVKSLMDEIKKYSIIITYYGTGFDIPFIRTKAVKYGYDGLEYGSNFHHDLYYTIKSKFKFHRNSLDAATSYFGIEGKTPVNMEVWYNAKYGEPKSIESVLDHNIEDVKITEELHNLVMPFRKWLRRSV